MVRIQCSRIQNPAPSLSSWRLNPVKRPIQNGSSRKVSQSSRIFRGTLLTNSPSHPVSQVVVTLPPCLTRCTLPKTFPNTNKGPPDNPHAVQPHKQSVIPRNRTTNEHEDQVLTSTHHTVNPRSTDSLRKKGCNFHIDS
jgi:hypothetical protein